MSESDGPSLSGGTVHLDYQSWQETRNLLNQEKAAHAATAENAARLLEANTRLTAMLGEAQIHIQTLCKVIAKVMP